MIFKTKIQYIVDACNENCANYKSKQLKNIVQKTAHT